MRKFHIQTKQSKTEQHVGDRRIGQKLQQTFEQIHIEGSRRRPGCRQCYRRARVELDLLPVDLIQQCQEVRRCQIDYAYCDSLVGGDVDRIANRLLGPLGIATA